MARRIKIKTDRTERAASPMGLLVLALALFALFIFIKRDKAGTKKHTEKQHTEKQEKQPEKDPREDEPTTPYQFINYTPEPPTPSPTEAKGTAPRVLRPEDAEYRRKSVNFANNAKPTDIQNFFGDSGSRMAGHESQLDYARRGLQQPERLARNPDREDHEELVNQVRGEGWHGEPIGAVSLHLLEQEGVISSEMINEMRQIEAMSEPRVALWTDVDIDDPSDIDIHVHPWGNIPERAYVFTESLVKLFNIPNLAMLMWTTRRKERTHWIQDHPIFPLTAVVAEAGGWPRSPASAKVDDYTIADPVQQRNILFGWFLLPYRGCGNHGASREKLESWAGGTSYRYIQDSIRDGISRTEYLLLVWLAWLGRRWMMRRVFTFRSADLLDGSVRAMIRPNLAKPTNENATPSMRFDVTVFVPPALINCCILDQPPETQQMLSKSWTQSAFTMWALNRVILEARPYVEQAAPCNDTKHLEEGAYRIPYVKKTRLYYRPGVCTEERNRGKLVPRTTGGNYETVRFPRPARLVVCAADGAQDRIQKLLASDHGSQLITVMRSLVLLLRPNNIEFLNLREHHQVDLAPGDKDQESLHPNYHNGSAMFCLLLALQFGLPAARKGRVPIEGIARETTAFNAQWREIDQGAARRAVAAEGETVKLRHMVIDFGGALPLFMTKDKIGEFQWPARLEEVLYFTLPLLDRMENTTDPAQNQPCTGQVILDPRYSILKSMTLADPCSYVICLASDPDLARDAIDNRIKADRLKLWRQLREYFVYALQDMLKQSAPVQETAEAYADRALKNYHELETLLNSKICTAPACNFQPNSVNIYATVLAFEYFDGAKTDAGKKTELVRILGGHQNASLALTDGPRTVPDFTPVDRLRGNTGIPVDKLNAVHGEPPPAKQESRESFDEGDEDDPISDDEPLSDHRVASDPANKAARMERLRNQHAQDLLTTVHKQWALFMIDTTTKLQAAGDMETVKSEDARIAQKGNEVDRLLIKAYKTFSRECQVLVKEPGGSPPGDYPGQDDYWLRKPLEDARLVVRQQYIAKLTDKSAEARYRLKPNLEDTARVLRAELEAEKSISFENLRSGILSVDQKTPDEKDLAMEIAKLQSSAIEGFYDFCEAALDRHLENLYKAIIPDPGLNEGCKGWWTEDKYGIECYDVLAEVCEQCHDDFARECPASVPKRPGASNLKEATAQREAHRQAGIKQIADAWASRWKKLEHNDFQTSIPIDEIIAKIRHDLAVYIKDRLNRIEIDAKKAARSAACDPPWGNQESSTWSDPIRKDLEAEMESQAFKFHADLKAKLGHPSGEATKVRLDDQGAKSGKDKKAKRDEQVCLDPSSVPGSSAEPIRTDKLIVQIQAAMQDTCESFQTTADQIRHDALNHISTDLTNDETVAPDGEYIASLRQLSREWVIDEMNDERNKLKERVMGGKGLAAVDLSPDQYWNHCRSELKAIAARNLQIYDKDSEAMIASVTTRTPANQTHPRTKESQQVPGTVTPQKVTADGFQSMMDDAFSTMDKRLGQLIHAFDQASDYKAYLFNELRENKVERAQQWHRQTLEDTKVRDGLFNAIRAHFPPSTPDKNLPDLASLNSYLAAKKTAQREIIDQHFQKLWREFKDSPVNAAGTAHTDPKQKTQNENGGEPDRIIDGIAKSEASTGKQPRPRPRRL